ncbi:MAG: aminoglycoside phosphotransferase family protein [Dehalococcoidia bacterium]|nr:aminoglycoside phosphotransferase family protein [Dehalococcoidia bacterium]
MDTWSAVCEYLREEIFPQIAPSPYGEVEAIKLAYEKPVYLFFERTKNIMVVGKYFQCESIPPEEARLSAEKEYLNLKLLREQFGMDGDGDKVVAPLGENKELSALLVVELVPGQTLDYYIAKAIYEQQSAELFEKLGYLARFFVKLHQSSKTARTISSDLPQWYLDKLLSSLSERGFDSAEICDIEKYSAQWWNQNSTFVTDREVIVHGDATPTNFLFHDKNVIGIDLERMKWADRCWDLGFIAAELKHHFMWRTGDGWAAEPFIGHFLWEYALYYGDSEFFNTITRKIPLYMSLGLLRITRNLWLDKPYIEHLVAEANQCLKYGLSSLTATVPL